MVSKNLDGITSVIKRNIDLPVCDIVDELHHRSLLLTLNECSSHAYKNIKIGLSLLSHRPLAHQMTEIKSRDEFLDHIIN